MKLKKLQRRIPRIAFKGLLLSFLLHGPLCHELFSQSFPISADWGPNTWARGGASVASALDHDAFTTNPAGLIRFYGQSSIAGSWGRWILNENKWSASMVDGTRAVVGGLQFNWADKDDIRRFSYNTGVAYNTNYGAAGVSMNIYDFSGLIEHNGWGVSQTAGILIPIGYGFMIGAAGKAFVDRMNDNLVPPMLSTGISYRGFGAVQFNFQADRRFSVPDQDWNFSFGGDVITKKFYSVHGGYRYDRSREESFWSTGLSLEAPKIKIAGVYTRGVGPQDGDDGFGFNLDLVF